VDEVKEHNAKHSGSRKVRRVQAAAHSADDREYTGCQA